MTTTPSMKSIQAQVFRELRGWSQDLKDALQELAPEVPVDETLTATQRHLGALAEAMPDPGLSAPHMRAFSIGGAIYIAFYLALKDRPGWDAARVWSVLERATELHFERMSGMDKYLAKNALFGWPMKALSRWLAKKSGAAPVGGWVFDFLEKSSDFDYGVNYQRCAIRELALSQGAAEFAPYICLSDIIGSKQFGWGLERTQTLAQGGSHCDFRFRKDGETKVKVRLPVTS